MEVCILSRGELPANQRARDIAPVLFQCWASVADAGPTLRQHRVSCLLCRTTANEYDCDNVAKQKEKAATVYCSGRQILHFTFARQSGVDVAPVALGQQQHQNLQQQWL